MENKQCCLCRNDDEGVSVANVVDEVEIDGHKFHVEMSVVPITEDETKYICFFQAARIIRKSFNKLVAQFQVGPECATAISAPSGLNATL